MTTLNLDTLNKVHTTDTLSAYRHGPPVPNQISLPEGSVDLIVADPPFGIAYSGKPSNYNRKASKVIGKYNEISAEQYPVFMRQFTESAHKWLKDLGHMYLFSGWTHLRIVLNEVENAGFHVVNHLVWKYQFGVATQKRFVTSHYHIIFCVANKRRLKHPTASKFYKFNKHRRYPEDVLTVKRDYWPGKDKPATKLPNLLIKDLVQFSAKPGDIVLDPFTGGGVVPEVCNELGIDWVAFEKDPDVAEFARRRVGK